jgi:hypothetical protein
MGSCISMNYFAHAYRFLDDPYFMAGTAVPDWLVVADRQVRVRIRHVEPFVDDADAATAAVARGIRQHLRDDARFHETRAFGELSVRVTVLAREALGGEAGLRPWFLGHLLVEVLLDAALIAEEPGRLEALYRALDAVDPQAIQDAVNRMAPRRTRRLATMVSEFCRLRILRDYLEDGRLMGRLNQVLRRVKQPELPAAIMPGNPGLTDH